MALETPSHLMDYPTLYASSRQGWAVKSRDDPKADLTPLFDAIVERGTTNT